MLGITLAREAFHLLHHQGMRQPKIEHAGQMGELKPLPPIGDFPHAELRSAHNRMGLEVVFEAESLSGRKRPLRTGRRLLVNCAARSGSSPNRRQGPLSAASIPAKDFSVTCIGTGM